MPRIVADLTKIARLSQRQRWIIDQGIYQVYHDTYTYQISGLSKTEPVSRNQR